MILLCLGILAQVPTVDLPLASFDATNYGSWRSIGTAFRRGPATTSMFAKLEIKNAFSPAIICSEIEDDRPQGILSSPILRIERSYIGFRIGGGNYQKSTCLNLWVGGKVVRSATGRRSDWLTPMSWDVREFRGRSAQIQVVDAESGDWGHINVDRLVQTDKPEAEPLVRSPLYEEPLRPQFHFTARQWTVDMLNPGMRQEGWINDLNGLIYYEGEWHLFAQRWARCWLHAVSKDLIHWTELQPAFWEESEGSGVQSGTCIIDYENTSGLAKDKDQPAMVAFWSRFDNVSQCISLSLDRGRTWTRYAGNPIFEKAERDPKVFWYAPGKHWVMMMYGDGQYHILNSPDLLHWTDQKHPIPNSFECPDFFELPIDGDESRKKWVLIQGDGNYSIGTFDGKEFKEEGRRHACDLGPNFYATQSWENTQTGDGRRIQTSWMRGSDFPNMPFNQQISFPCELKLRSTPGGLRIFREPIKEIETIQDKSQTWTNRSLAEGEVVTLAAKGDLYRLVADVEIGEGATLTFDLRGNSVVVGHNSLRSGEAHGTVSANVQMIEILLDRGSIEAFINHGELSSTRYALAQRDGISLKAEGGAVTLKSLNLYPLRSVWPKGVK